MLVSSTNSYSNYQQVYGYNGSAMQSNNLQNANDLTAVEPVAPIGTSASEYTDVNDISYERVNDFVSREIAKSNNTNQPGTEQQDASAETNQTFPEANSDAKTPGKTESTAQSNDSEDTKPTGEALTEEEQVMVNKLKTVDTNVRQHEQAHLAVAGGIAASGASYTYQSGPDGKQYAVGGEVNIDTSTEDTPEATIQKMNQVIAAAMAPADPSSQDFAVASSARRIIAEMGKIRQSEADTSTDTDTSETAPVPNVQSAAIPDNNTVTQNATSTNASLNLNTTNADSNSNRQPTNQRSTIEEPISTLSARQNASRQIELYKRNDLNSQNNLSSSKINIIVA